MNINKNILMGFTIVFLCLIFISSVYGFDGEELAVSASETDSYTVNSQLSNDEIQNMFDNAENGATFDFIDEKYSNISLTVNKPLNVISNVGSIIEVSDSGAFGFYFTSESSGSLLSGFKIIPSNGCGVLLDGSDNTVISNNEIIGGSNGIIAKNANNISITENNVSKASVNGLQVQNCKNSLISLNNIFDNKRSGIEATSISNCVMSLNNISYNKFNGITLYGRTSYNLITHNVCDSNLNGIYIDCVSEGDKIIANSAWNSFKDPSSELGGFETGNGILFGPNYKVVNKKAIEIRLNYLAHNENFQVKNNPSQNVISIGENYYNSNDDEDTFVCPMLLSRILLMKLDLNSVPGGFLVQIEDGNSPVDDLGDFKQTINIDGQEYEVDVKGGQAQVNFEDLGLDPNVEHTVEVTVGKKTHTYEVPPKTPATEEEVKEPVNDETGKNPDTEEATGNSSTNGEEIETPFESVEDVKNPSNSTMEVPSQSLDVISEAINSGTNSSDIIRQDTSNQGENAKAQSQDSSSSKSGSSSAAAGESKAYELSTPTKKTSKTSSDISVVIVIGVFALISIFIIGFKRKNDFN